MRTTNDEPDKDITTGDADLRPSEVTADRVGLEEPDKNTVTGDDGTEDGPDKSGDGSE